MTRQRTSSAITLSRLGYAAVCVAGAALFVILALRAGESGALRADAELRRRLLDRAVEISRVINPELAAQLTFTIADRGTPAFEHIRRQLIIMAAGARQRGIYTMALRNGTIVFGPESYAVSDPMASPPGTVYEQPVDQDFSVFRTGVPATFGPYTDEYGMFVSAFAPVVDSRSGTVLMVVGVDVLATDWQAALQNARRRPLFMLAGLLLVVAGAVALRRRSRRMPSDRVELRKRITVPVIIVVVLSIVLYLLYGHREFGHFQYRTMDALRDTVRSGFYQGMESKRAVLNAVLNHIEVDPVINQALHERNRVMLAAHIDPLHERLQREHGITHTSIAASDRTVLYRAHLPDRWGDFPERTTFLAACDTGHDVWGVEADEFGGLMFHYVRPVRRNGSVDGYIKLGINIEDIISWPSRDMDLEMVAVVNKAFTSREAFELGKDRFGFIGAWDDYPGVVLVHGAAFVLPDTLHRMLLEGPVHRFDDRVFMEDADGKRLVCSVISIPDSAGRPLAALIMLKDMTAESAFFRTTTVFNVTLAVALMGCVCLLLWSITGVAERQLRGAFRRMLESENLFRSLFNNALSGVAIHEIVVDENGSAVDFRFLEVNPAFEKHTGVPAEQVAGRRVIEVFPFVKNSEMFEIYSRVVFTGRSASFEQYVEPLQRYFNINVFQLAPGRFATVFQNITERKEMEASLKRELDARLRIQDELIANTNLLGEIQQVANIGMLTFDINTRRFIWSDEACRILGFDPGTSLSFHDFADLVHPDDYDVLAQHWSRAQADSATLETYYRILRANGEVRYIHEYALYRCGQDGALLQLAALLQDVTERTLAEERLRQLSQAVEQSPVLVVITDPAGIIQYVNPRFVELTGYAAEEVIGKNPRILKSGETPSDVYEELWQIITAGGKWQGTFYNKKKNGELYWEGAVISPIRDAQDRITHFLAIKEDITERKHAEEQLRQVNRDLEQAIARANDMALQAELANMTKSEFLANMSHEIRTPMNGVIGMTGLLLDSELTDEQRQFAQIVRSCGESLLVLINEILDLSKIEAGKCDLEELDFDLRATMEDTAELLWVKAAEKEIELVCMVDPDVPVRLRGDPGRLRQLFMNLGGNAIKFTERGSLTLRAMLESEEEDRVTVRFTVIDTGIGIPRDKQQAVFNPFTQVDGSTTRKYGGTGLGLTISKRLAELMGGDIGLESRPGHGTTFWFTAVFAKQQPGRMIEPPPMADLAGVRVLVVDDHATNRFLVTTLLQAWGCPFTEASDADTALERLHGASAQNDPYRIALLDMQMAGMNGAELGRRIRQSPDIARTHLIMMTSLGQRGDTACFKAEEFDGYLNKPLRQAHLRDCMAMVLGKAQACEGQSFDFVTRHTISEARKQRVRILVAEDNATNQIVALKTLEKLGYSADAVSGGAEALDALRAINYDIVLMDCQMPGLDGFEATRRIRSKKKGVLNSRVPVIAMTAHAMYGDRERCLEAGMDDYLSKPVDPAALAAVLERWLTDSDMKSEKELSEKPREPDGDAAVDAVPVFVRSAFQDRLMGDEDVMRLVIEKFVSEFAGQRAQLESAADSGDSAAAWQLGHKIKGAAANLSAESLRAIASEIEQAGKAGDIERVRVLAPELGTKFEALHACFRNEGLA